MGCHPRFHLHGACGEDVPAFSPWGHRGHRGGRGHRGFRERGERSICKPHKHEKMGGKGGKKFLAMRVMELEQQVQMLQEQVVTLTQE